MKLLRKSTLILLAACSSMSMQAQEKNLSDYVSTPKFGGYIIGSYTWQNDDGSINDGSGFDLRLVRVYVDGKVLDDFKYRLQMEMNGEPGNDKGPRIIDATIEWAKYAEFSVKVGQFKRAFTFENPYNPWDTGFGAYSQLVSKLAGFSDRVGEHSSGGRDQGIQIQGDLFPSRADGHRFLHYQVAVYNGEGINHKDQNKKKDLIGTLQLVPIKNLYIGAFGWTGAYGVKGQEVSRNRYALGVKYEGDWSVRAEYAHSQGKKYDTATNTVKENSADKADAWYAAVGVPVTKKLKVYGKWDVYRDDATSDTQKSIYGLSANYRLCKNLMFQAGYNYIHDKTNTLDQHYSQVLLQAYIRW